MFHFAGGFGYELCGDLIPFGDDDVLDSFPHVPAERISAAQVLAVVSPRRGEVVLFGLLRAEISS